MNIDRYKYFLGRAIRFSVVSAIGFFAGIGMMEMAFGDLKINKELKVDSYRKTLMQIKQ